MTCYLLDIPIIECLVKNIGSYLGDEVVMVYHTISDEIRKEIHHPAPIKTLV